MAGNININMRVGGGCGCDSGGGSGGSGGGGGGSAGTFPIVDTLAGNEADKAPSVRAVNAGLATKATLGDDGKLPEDVLPITVIGNAFYRGAFADGAALAAAHPDDVAGAYATVLSTGTMWIWNGTEWEDTQAPPPNTIQVVNNLTSDSASDALSAYMGKVLDEGKADRTELTEAVTNLTNLIQNIQNTTPGGVTWEAMEEAINAAFLARGLTGTLLSLLRTLYPMDGDDGKIVTVRANGDGTFRLELQSFSELSGGGGGGIDPSTLTPEAFTTAGNHVWVVPEGINRAYITMCGAGGDKASTGSLTYYGGGGAAVFRQPIGITQDMWNTNVPITVGAAPGGASSVGSIVACEGGGSGSTSTGYGAGGNPGGYSGDHRPYGSLNMLYTTSVPQITIAGVRLGTTYNNVPYGCGSRRETTGGDRPMSSGLVLIEYSI